MFDEAIVVKSAVSAFNNAALVGPAFLWSAILAVPLFIMVYFCGNSFLEKIGWNRNNIILRSGIATAVLVLLWIILFDGNYAVLRDGVSVLPYVTAAILFMCTVFVVKHVGLRQLPRFRDMSRRMRLATGGALLLCLAAVGLSDMHAWWGPILQIGAVLAGVFCGEKLRRTIPPMLGAMAIMIMCVIAILMQPEFFRFGQLGNLTVLHMMGILIFGGLVAATMATANVVPRGKVHHSAYVKLKWLMRFIVVLGGVLFFMTESVPVFVGTVAAMFCMFAFSVWHCAKISDNLSNLFFALTLGAFGVITTMPVISALGILCWVNLSRAKFWPESKFLL